MRRILFITSCEYYGGAFEALAQVILRLQDRYLLRPVLVCKASFGEEWARQNGVRCHRLYFARINGKGVGRYLLDVVKLIWICLIERIDVIYANHLLAGIVCYPAAGILHKPLLSVCHQFHGPDDFWRLEQRILKRLSRIVVVSDAVKKSLRPIVGDGPELIVIGNFLTQKDLQTAGSLLDGDGLRRLKVPGKPVFGMVSRIASDKRQDLGLRFFSAVLRKIPEAHMLIAGTSNTPQQVDFEKRLRDMVLKMGLNHHVEFIGFQEHMSSVYKRLDFLISPSPEEAFGRVIIEAYAHGLPVVAFKGGGSAEVVSQGETGWILDPENPEEGSSEVLDVLRNQESYAMISRRCLETAVEKYNGENEARRIASLLRCLDSVQIA